MNSLFKIFSEKISLTELQKKDAIQKYSGVGEVLHNSYYPEAEYDGSSILLIGSYGKQTNIRPPRDIDLVFRITQADFDRINNLAGNKQSQLLQEFRRILIESYPLTEEIKAFGKVVVVPFAEGTHSVEVLPALEQIDGSFIIPDTADGGSWQTSNPISEMDNIDKSQKQTGMTLEFIKMCKKWGEFCNVDIDSYVLEILVINFLDTLRVDFSEIEYSKLSFDFFSFLSSQINTTLVRPTGETVDLGNSWETKCNSAVLRAQKALEFEGKSDVENAAREWKKIFSDDFPLPEVRNKISDTIENLRRLYPTDEEEFLKKDYNIITEINPDFNLKIDAIIDQKGYRVNSLREFVRQNFKLKRHKSITFSITRNTVPDYDKIMWKIRNFGDEARSMGQLRGQIHFDDGNKRRVETTRYLGDHFVECYVIKNNKCVAISNIFVPIGNES